MKLAFSSEIYYNSIRKVLKKNTSNEVKKRSIKIVIIKDKTNAYLK